MAGELATAEVKLEVDFAHLEEDVRKGLEARVRKAAKVAQAELDATEVAAAALGDTIEKKVGGAADKAGAKLKRVSMTARVELEKTGKAAEKTAEALQQVLGSQDAGTLFDVDVDAGVIRLNQAVRDVQESLFDLDAVEIEKITVESDKAATSLRTRLAGSARTVGGVLRRVFRRRNLIGPFDDVDELADKMGKLGRQADKSGSQLDRFSGRLGILVSAIAAGVAIAPALVVGAAAIGAFAAAAVPSLVRVIKTQSEMSDRWDGLTRSEKIAAAQTRALVQQFNRLGQSLAPDVLRAYNGVLANTALLLPEFKPLAREAADALTEANQRIGEGLDSERTRRFFDFLQAEAGPAIDQIVTVFLDAAAASASLIEALAPLASVGLGTVSMFLRLLTAVTDVSPELAQLVVIALALRSPLAAVGGTLGKLAKPANGASLATRALNAVTSAGPNLYLAAGTALAFMAIKTLTAKTSTDKLLASLREQNRAIGNNLAGYRAYGAELDRRLAGSNAKVTASFQTFRKEATATNLELLRGRAAAEAYIQVPMSAEFKRNAAATRNVEAGAKLLADRYGLTTDAAISLADAVGVNLSRGIITNGEITASAAQKFEAYRYAATLAASSSTAVAEAWDRATNAALGLKAQIQGLQDVYDRSLNPSLALLDANNALLEAQKATAKAFKDGKTTALERQQLLSQEITALRGRAQAEFAAHKTTRDTTAEIIKRLPMLRRLAGNTEEGTEAIRGLIGALQGTVTEADGTITIVDKLGRRIRLLPNGKIKIEAETKQAEDAVARAKRAVENLPDSKQIYVNVITNALNQAARIQQQLTPRADGGLVGVVRRAAGGRVRGPGGPRSDKIHALLSNGEYVINARSTRKYLGLLEALNADRFADGGLAGVPRLATGGRVKVDPAAHRVAVVLGLDISPQLERQLAGRIKTIGEKLGADLTRSLLGTPAEISRAIRGLEKDITKAFSGIKTKLDTQLIARLEKINKRLTEQARQRDDLAKKIEDATRLRDTVADRARDFASLTGFDDVDQSSAQRVADTLAGRLAQLRQFARDLKSLAAQGLDKTVIQQLAEAGPQQGGELARTLATSSRATLNEISKLQRQINTEAGKLGTDVADTLFDSGRAAGLGFLAGLKDQRAAIEKEMTDIARTVAKTVKKELKIRSPSRVMHGAAVDTLLGYVDGLRATAGRVRAALVDAVRPAAEVQRAAALRPATASRADAGVAGGLPGGDRPTRQTIINQNNVFNQVTHDANTLLALSERRLLAAIR